MDKLSLSVANVISGASVLSCMVLKLPQIIFVKEKQSAQGLNVLAILLEMTALTIATLYNYTNHNSVKTYFEYPIILLQTYVLLFYTLVYEKLFVSPAVLLGVFAYLATTLGFVMGLLPKDFIPCLFSFYTPLNVIAKLAYIYGIVQAGNSSSVSLITWNISIFINIARLLTVFLVSGDVQMIASFTLSTLLSTAVLMTAVCFKQ